LLAILYFPSITQCTGLLLSVTYFFSVYLYFSFAIQLSMYRCRTIQN